MNIFKNKQLAFFVGGLVTAIIGKEIATSSKARNVAVNTVAKGMEFQKNAQIFFQNIKEDAEDLVHDAQVLQGQENAKLPKETRKK